jgi:hypothetical protein
MVDIASVLSAKYFPDEAHFRLEYYLNKKRFDIGPQGIHGLPMPNRCI